ncbi:MAG: formyltransferase family protein, partial [Planctomycetota bacterium]
MSRPRLGVLVSGGGTTLQNLIDREAAGSLAGTVAVVISSKPGVRGLERAEKAGLPHHVVSARKLDAEAFSARISAILEEAEVDLVILGGFLRLWDFPPRWRH